MREPLRLAAGFPSSPLRGSGEDTPGFPRTSSLPARAHYEAGYDLPMSPLECGLFFSSIRVAQLPPDCRSTASGGTAVPWLFELSGPSRRSPTRHGGGSGSGGGGGAHSSCFSLSIRLACTCILFEASHASFANAL